MKGGAAEEVAHYLPYLLYDYDCKVSDQLHGYHKYSTENDAISPG